MLPKNHLGKIVKACMQCTAYIVLRVEEWAFYLYKIFQFKEKSLKKTVKSLNSVYESEIQKREEIRSKVEKTVMEMLQWNRCQKKLLKLKKLAGEWISWTRKRLGN